MHLKTAFGPLLALAMSLSLLSANVWAAEKAPDRWTICVFFVARLKKLCYDTGTIGNP